MPRDAPVITATSPFRVHDRLPASLLVAIALKVALLIVTTLAEMLGQLMFYGLTSQIGANHFGVRFYSQPRAFRYRDPTARQGKRTTIELCFEIKTAPLNH
jgi:hypothetical protein